MSVYYNEIDPYAAQWLRNLIAAGHLPAGHVDERSIEDVTPADLAGYTQCHFFAGIGGWPLALRLAGWADSRPAWTGSCPCQPFSAAGKGAGFADERHLWPAWHHLIAQCRPPVIFGEQVASKDAEPWVDLVHADLEGMGYAFGCVPFPSAGVGAPHIRDRAYWVAHAGSEGLSEQYGRWVEPARFAQADGAAGRMADATRGGRREERAHVGRGGIGDCPQGHAAGLVHGGSDCWLAAPHGEFTRVHAKAVHAGESELSWCSGDGRPGPTNGHWRAADWLGCTDGKWRPVEPGAQPLAYGIPNRVGRLRAYGNAINPWQAAEFILAYAQARGLIALERAA